MKEDIITRIFELKEALTAAKNKEASYCSGRDITFLTGLLNTNINILFIYYPEEIENSQDYYDHT